MKIYTLFTPTHREMFEEFFIKTLPFDSRVELRAQFKDQTCNAEFHSEGWRATMAYKVKCFIQGANEVANDEIFMFIDPDIQFFEPFVDDVLNHMSDCDGVFQNDYHGGVNTGFFALRSTKNVRAFLKTVEGNLDKFAEEQQCFNHLISNFSKMPTISFKAKMLPKNYWTYGEVVYNNSNKSHWDGNDLNFDIPKNLKMHHSNWTKKFEYKIPLLKLIRKKYNEIK